MACGHHGLPWAINHRLETDPPRRRRRRDCTGDGHPAPGWHRRLRHPWHRPRCHHAVTTPASHGIPGERLAARPAPGVPRGLGGGCCPFGEPSVAQVWFLPSQTSHLAANPIPIPGYGHRPAALTHLRRPQPTNQNTCANSHRWGKKSTAQSSLLPNHVFRLREAFGTGGSASIASEHRWAPQRHRRRLQHPSPGLSGGRWEGCGTGAGGCIGDVKHSPLRRQRWARGLHSNKADAEPKTYWICKSWS